MNRTLQRAACAIAALLSLPAALAQTTAGSSTTIVVPVAAQTASFASEVTLFNPNGSDLSVGVQYYDANNLASAGPKACTAVTVAAHRSKAFALADQCTLGAGSHFGLLVVSEQTQTLELHGYVRTQNPQGIGFSTEGFPHEHFGDALAHATGLKRTAAAGGLPAFQTNCFAASLDAAVSYELRLFNGTSGAQLGSTVTGSLAAHQQFRYLDVFGPAGVNAPAGDWTNVRAEFTNLTGGVPLVGFCTVQENQSFSADFRIAKSQSAALSAGGILEVVADTGLAGGGTTPTVTLALATPYRLPQGCGSGQVPKWNAGTWTCGNDLDTNSGGTVTGVTAGTGLTGGTVTTSGTLAADTAYLQRRVSSTCPAGSSIRAIAADGTVTCQTDSSGPANAFVQGGNAFGATAVLGTTDANALDLRANGNRALRLEFSATSPNVLGGYASNGVFTGVVGASVAGGGAPGAQNALVLGVTCTRVYGCTNSVTDSYGTIAGGVGNIVGDGSAGITDAAFATVGGGIANWAQQASSTVSGGISNTASGNWSSVAGGNTNTASGIGSTVAGGGLNTASGVGAVIGGGFGNTANGNVSLVSGGDNNLANGSNAAILGGRYNTASGSNSAVGGGDTNIASGANAAVPGGNYNTAAGTTSFAAGYVAKANYAGCFVWADSTSAAATSCFGNNEFVAKATGGFYFWTAGTSDATYSGARLAPGAGAWSAYSDRQGKENVAPVDSIAVLEKLASIPMTTWNWKAQEAGVRHMGPMAQDFRDAFGLGESDRTISTIDADGVALAAIQGLHQIVRAAAAEIADLRRQTAEIAELRRKAAELDRLKTTAAQQQRELAELRGLIEGLLARTDSDSRVAQLR